ncbi:hypothetical protein HMPREF3202_00336 [Prevotella bivia]|uniref:Uncharacterized protein n=1 Tax=Prevotella bivia TaxID=28125 RepID=A0A137T0F4_9BACT|nr:hypothetical protein HMPREF3202_00336 [Prevotella bivia]
MLLTFTAFATDTAVIATATKIIVIIIFLFFKKPFASLLIICYP